MPRLAKPEILLIGFVGGTGGASMLMLELAAALVHRGMPTKIVVPAWDSTVAYASACEARGVPVERTHWLEEREPRTRAYVDSLCVALRYRAPIVHFHLATNVMPGRYLPALRYMPFRRAFVSMHDPYDDPPAHSAAARRWAAAAPHVFDSVICVSRAGRDRQIAYGVPPDRVRLIYNGIDVARFGAGTASEARAQIGVGPEAQLILASSRIAPQKRPLDALAAFARLAPACPDAHLVFLGDGAMRSAVHDEAVRLGLAARVHLPGQRFDVPNWLAAASVWLLPTESEGFSLAVLEAMAAGCPIVSTDCPGNDEILVNGRNALLSPVGDVAGFSDHIRRLFCDQPLRSRLGATAREDARRFSIGRMVEEHLELYGGGGRS